MNLASVAGVLIAVSGRTKLVRGGTLNPAATGVLIAGNYGRRWPAQTTFTVGGVIIARRPAAWLLGEGRESLLRHELIHSTQYALLGPLFWPLYWLAALFSYLTTGSASARNIFERWAGLAAGGYADLPLSPRLDGLLRRLRR
ncbi:hypothetical protein JIG36_45965 [Actinoplanes sp. LDG1-06]|uniref:DUF4157 domain-containing protein n=1 Tax=Paractinoplanes ovalisporus TaxID=2810368 RepID=A0ABS2ASN8_9ACTN|nr:hypothetical protein [Actinoplanes ovalisporus]